MKLSIQLIKGPEELGALAAELDQIAMRPRLPFATSSWLGSWWRHFREDRFLVRDRFFAHALRDERGTLIAVAPLMLTERPATGPLRVRTIGFWGGDKNITELRGLVCAPEHEGIATRTLLAHLLTQRDEWDWFIWDGVRLGGEAHRALSGESSVDWRSQTASHVLLLPDTWEEFRATRSRNVKESLRKCYNSLKRDQLRFSFRVVEDASELPAALEGCLRLHGQRARAADLADHADYFTGEAARCLLSDLARAPQQTPSLRVLELRIGDELVASRLAFLLEDELYLYFSGFDPKWARYSVMTTTVAEAIKWAIERKLRVVNLSTGTDVSKTRWSPAVVTTCSGILTSPTATARLKWRLFQELSRRSRSQKALGRVLDLARRRG